MSTGKEKLSLDLRIVEDMAAEMEDYLASPQLFWPKIDHKLVQPTIGGFWLRRHRLEALQNILLDGEERQRFVVANQQFDTACSEQRHRFEEKVGREVEARLRQWGEALRELLADEPPSIAYYRSDVEIRAIIEALLHLSIPRPADVEQGILERLEKLDRDLKQRWKVGRFVWPEAWAVAYPDVTYWWLYGQLK